MLVQGTHLLLKATISGVSRLHNQKLQVRHHSPEPPSNIVAIPQKLKSNIIQKHHDRNHRHDRYVPQNVFVEVSSFDF